MAKPLSMIKLLVRLPFIFLLVPCLCCPAYQKQSLLHFKSSLLTSYETSNSSSFGLESWDSITDCCKWTRVVCSSHSRDITALHLDHLRMYYVYKPVNVQILDPIYGIRSLRFLNISRTLIEGEISGEGLANLTKLIHLDMSWNLLNGSIPAQLFQLRFLQSLDLSVNSLKNGLSGEIGKLENLRSFKLDKNSMDGNIPVQIGNLTRLQQFSVSRNKFLGRIPESILNLKALEKLDSQNLSVLDLSRNNFSGELPQNIGHALNMTVLMLSGNSFSGSIPKSIGDIPFLMLLDLSRNRLSGNTFPVFSSYRSPQYVDLSSNELSGDIPLSLFEGTSFLALGKNKFTGSLPRNLTHIENLEYLDLHDNNITGNFSDFLKLPNLHVLSLRNNSLHGSLSTNSFYNKSSLQILDLSSNNIVGSIPSEFGNLRGMSGNSSGSRALASGNNEIEVNWIEATVSLFSGMYTTRIEINDLTVNWKNAMQGLSSHNRHIYTLLDLSNNKFSGDVPDSLGNLKGLKLLNLSYNKLSGYIPQSFGDLESIEALDLSNNNISGTIPQSLGKLDQLSVLDVSNNKLSGEIPRGGQMDRMNDPSYFANNSGLCGMQIRVNCSKDEPTPNEGQEEDDDEKEPWFLWTGAWIGFPLGLISTVLTAFLGGYFVIPTAKYHSIHYRQR
uniref:Uncharacterized protein n=1 Tax=Daucus carota subsp. sativus TaxID=79200 RepID=A0A175YI69_DAUCS